MTQLDDQQIMILEHLKLGLSDKQIAARTNMDHVRVQVIMKKIIRNMGVRNRTQAVLKFIGYLP